MTRKSIALPVSLGLLAVLVAAAFFVFGNPARSEAAGGPPQGVPPAGVPPTQSENILVALVGTDTATVTNLPDFGDSYGAIDGALCFNVDLIDLNTNEVIGDATDCLSHIKSDDEGSSMALIGTTIFNFPQGQLVSRGHTTVQPILGHPSALPLDLATEDQDGFTHTTGAPAPLSGSNIISGTGVFQNVVGNGTVRLSGLVNLSRLGSHSEITFDCLFVINLD